MGSAIMEPVAEADRAIMADGYVLPLRSWLPEESPRAVVLAIHGFSDYGHGFHSLSEPLVAGEGIALYAYDQRGFGATAEPGIWAGSDTLVADLHTLMALLRELYPDIPIYLMGESMGAAVTMLALKARPPVEVNGVVLLAPAVWGLETMPWYQRWALWLGMRLMPERSFSSESVRRLGISPSDDPEVMRELAMDPLVLKQARVDTLHGVTLLMGEAASVPSLPVPALLLYGDNDQVIPPYPVCRWLRGLEPDSGVDIALYPGGYHMLTRYSGREVVIGDIAHWLRARDETSSPSLPSGYGATLPEAVERVCGW